MAIEYRQEALPNVSSFPFDVNYWGGVNQVSDAQQDGEMSDCINMSSDSYPYAGPREKRKKILSEDGIKRIYNVSDGYVYYIDKNDLLCRSKNNVRENITYINKDKETKNVKMSDCVCTNNYDNNSMFYPNMSYVKSNEVTENEPNDVTTGFKFDGKQNGNAAQPIVYWTKDKIYIDNTDQRNVTLQLYKWGAKPHLWGHEKYRPELAMYIFNADEENKLNTENTDFFDNSSIKKADLADGYNIKLETFDFSQTQDLNTYEFTLPDNVSFEQGDYIRFAMYNTSAVGDIGASRYVIDNVDAVNDKSTWYISNSPCSPKIKYGTVYNNRIVGVKKNDIRVSALGDFVNFTEYADEDGNPSATGAYATDVGSAGDFTGICVYNNVLLLFKRNMIYEMYGSMPYTITELCSVGCVDNDSICEINGILYWASPMGIVRYSGGVPAVISQKININTNGKVKAGTDGRKYYVYDEKHIYVFDTMYNVWHIEDDKKVSMYYSDCENLYMVSDDGIYLVNSEDGTDLFEWEFKTKDYNFKSAERKNLSKLWIRTKMKNMSKLEIYVRQDGGEWKRCAVKTAEKDEMFDFKLRIKKCDSFALKFRGTGSVKVLDIHGKVTVTTKKHRSGASLNVYRR